MGVPEIQNEFKLIEMNLKLPDISLNTAPSRILLRSLHFMVCLKTSEITLQVY